jgi:hypothetical protein
MAYLRNENNEIIVDAILTKYGREKISKDGNLGITKFALCDDEIDYSLYNTNHPNGTQYYDIAIRELPILEALSGLDVSMKHLLFTNTDTDINYTTTLSAVYPSIFTSGISTISIPYNITPTLSPVPTSNDKVYYTAEMNLSTLAIVKLEGQVNNKIGYTNEILESMKTSKTQSNSEVVRVVGHSFTFTVKQLPLTTMTYTVKINCHGPVNANQYNLLIKVNAVNTGGNSES